MAVTRVHRGHYFQGHVEEMFRKHIVPLYGGQARALSSALQGSDRTCQALVDLDAYSHHNEPVGIVVHKNNGTDEFRAFGLTNSFEIKTLVLADPANHSNKGYGGYLLSLAADAARVAGCRTMHVTVSSTTESAMRFFMRRGFTKKHLWTDRYVTGVTEHLLARPTPEVGLDGTYNWDDNPHEHQTALALTHPAPAQARGTDERLDKKRGRESFECVFPQTCSKIVVAQPSLNLSLRHARRVIGHAETPIGTSKFVDLHLIGLRWLLPLYVSR